MLCLPGDYNAGYCWRKRHGAGSVRLPIGRRSVRPHPSVLVFTLPRCRRPPTVILGASGCVAFLERFILKFTFVLLAGTNPRLPRGVVGWEQNDGESTLIGRGYFVRQAATLLKFAQTTTDPKVAAGLVDKAADLRSQVDETSALPDLGARAPDVEPPAAS